MPSATDYSIISIEDVKAALSIKSTDATQDNLLSDLIVNVSDATEVYLNRKVVARSVTSEKWDGDGGSVLMLPAPLVSITTLIDDTTTLTLTTDYIWYAKTGKVLRVSGIFTDGPQKITVTYRYGWEKDQIPGAIRLAVLKWVVHEWFALKKDRVGVASKSSGDETITYIVGIPSDVEGLLLPYRVTGFGA